MVQTWQKVKLKAADAERLVHLKTLRIFDLSLKLQKEIIMEQVDGNFEPYRINVSSMLIYNFSLYYFKRLYMSKGPSILQLFKTDLQTGEGTIVAGYKVEEKQNNEEV